MDSSQSLQKNVATHIYRKYYYLIYPFTRHEHMKVYEQKYDWIHSPVSVGTSFPSQYFPLLVSNNESSVASIEYCQPFLA